MATSARLDELKKKFDENPRRYFAPLANEYRKLGDLSQAIALCRAHLPNQPGHISGHIVLAQALYEARELGEARSIFEAALDLDPENLIALRYLGDIAREQGEPASARTWYERVLDADPRNDEIAALLKELEQADSAPEPVVATAAGFVAAPVAELALPPADEPFRTNAVSGAFDALAAEPSVQPIPLESSVAGDLTEVADVASVLGMEVSRLSDGEANDSVDFAPVAALAETPMPSHETGPSDPFFGAAPEAALEMGELEAVVDASVDDWFGAPTEHSEHVVTGASDPAAFDDSFFPDLAAATPVASETIPETVALSFSTPTEVDVQAPTPPFVRVEEPRSTIPTPAFLSAIALPEATEPAELATPAEVSDAGDLAPPSAVMATEESASASDPEPAAADVAPVFVSAYESEHSREHAQAAEAVEAADAVDAVDAVDQLEVVEASASLDAPAISDSPIPQESFDWHSAPTPVDSPVIPEWRASVSETPLSIESVELPAAEALPTAENESAPVADAGELVDFSAWIAEAPSGEAQAPVAAEFEGTAVAEFDSMEPEVSATEELEPVESVESAPVSAELPNAEPLEFAPEISSFESEEPVAAEAIAPEAVEIEALAEPEPEPFVVASEPEEVSAAATSSDFILEEGVFDSSAADDVAFIANRVSVPDETDDAYSVGAPELSAHEPFPIESERENELGLTTSPLAGWGDAIEGTADEVESSSIVAPMEGLVSRETPADLAAIAGAALYGAHAAREPEGANDAVNAADSSEGSEPAEALVGDANDAVPAEALIAAGAGAAPVAAEPAAFVTETMAELYLQQGFQSEALAIYRQLLAQQPNDPVLSERVAALERGAVSAVVGGIAPRDTIDRAGQSVRSFFLHFARREPRHSASRAGEDEGEASEPHGAQGFDADRTPSYSGVATREEALTVPDAPSSSSGSAASATTLSDLFAAGAVSGSDDRAASALASAFGGGETSPTPPSGGERELSLEHLFRDVPERSSGAVTLDEFYEGSSPGSSAPTSPGGEGGEERDADIEQFTAWLEGLKKK